MRDGGRLTPEEQARVDIDRPLEVAGWSGASVAGADIGGGRGVAIRNVPIVGGLELADYPLMSTARWPA
jgi:hypothetical protein